MTLSNRDLRLLLGEEPAPKKKAKERDKIDVTQGDTELFSFIAIETGAACNRRCTFCPVAYDTREDEWMSDEMFTHIIDQLAAMGYRQRVSLYSYNEPVRDKRLPAMLAQVRRSLPRSCIMINTNGDYFHGPDDIAKLYDAGLNQMQINIYSSADGCGEQNRIAHGIEKAKKRYELLKSWVDSLPWLDQQASIYQHIGARKTACQVVPKWNFQPKTDHDNYLPADVHGVSKRHHIANRAGHIPLFMPALPDPVPKMCIRPFRAMTINWRGDTLLCCNDYKAEASSGNVMQRSLTDLWNDQLYQIYRIKLKAKQRDIFLCDVCDYAGGFYQFNTQAVTLGDETDREILSTDMRSREKLYQIRNRYVENLRGPESTQDGPEDKSASSEV